MLYYRVGPHVYLNCNAYTALQLTKIYTECTMITANLRETRQNVGVVLVVCVAS